MQICRMCHQVRAGHQCSEKPCLSSGLCGQAARHPRGNSVGFKVATLDLLTAADVQVETKHFVYTHECPTELLANTSPLMELFQRTSPSSNHDSKFTESHYEDLIGIALRCAVDFINKSEFKAKEGNGSFRVWRERQLYSLPSGFAGPVEFLVSFEWGDLERIVMVVEAKKPAAYGSGHLQLAAELYAAETFNYHRFDIPLAKQNHYEYDEFEDQSNGDDIIVNTAENDPLGLDLEVFGVLSCFTRTRLVVISGGTITISLNDTEDLLSAMYSHLLHAATTIISKQNGV